MMGILTLSSCQDDERELGEIIPPTNLSVETIIVGQDNENPHGDGSGKVQFVAKADNALSYDIVFNNTSNVSTSGEIDINFTTNGVNKYNLVAVANGQGGLKTSIPIQVEVLTSFQLPSTLLEKLTGSSDRSVNSSKTWRIKSEVTAHFGLGPVGGLIPSEWFGVAPFEKEDTGMYDDEYIFSSDGTFEHITNGTVFGRVVLIDELGATADVNTSEQGDDILNLPLENYIGNWSASGSEELINLNLSEKGFIGYYVGGNHSYELFEFENQSDNDFILRITGGNNEFDWWFIITSGEATLDVVYENLIWTDEFDIDGAPDSNNWGYDIGNGSNGWGNNEEQYYTDRSDNVIISNGTLKITAKRESFNGSEYTSTRMLTMDKYEFTYGRVDIRAKLPKGEGTWPALWMLGANFSEVGWPATGEIDIMEHVGSKQDEISSAIHTPSSFGDTENVGGTIIEGVSDDFHVYSVNWSEDEISFLVDNMIFYQYNPNDKTEDNWPFNKDQFLILNVAMGGTLGGTIDPAFTESTMEIDYVRVYQ